MRWTLRCLAFGFSFKAIILTSEKSFRHSPIVVDHFCHYSETVFSQQTEYIPRCIITPCSVLFPHPLHRFSHFILQNKRAFSSVCFIFRFDFYVFWSIRLNVDSVMQFSQISITCLWHTNIFHWGSSKVMFWIPWFSFQISFFVFLQLALNHNVIFFDIPISGHVRCPDIIFGPVCGNF